MQYVIKKDETRALITCSNRADMLVKSGDWVISDVHGFNRVKKESEKKIGREIIVGESHDNS